VKCAACGELAHVAYHERVRSEYESASGSGGAATALPTVADGVRRERRVVSVARGVGPCPAMITVLSV
jgi:hypothetical protein